MRHARPESFAVLKRFAAAVFSATVASSAGHAATSDAMVIAREDLVSEIQMPPGRCCAAKPTFAADGKLEAVALGACMEARFENGLLELVWGEAPDERRTSMVARLSRGAYLLQSRESDGSYLLHMTMIREAGLAILPEAGLDLTVLEAPGAPEEVFMRLRSQASRRFDRALRDQELGRRLLNGSSFILRTEEGATPEAAKAAVEALQTGILCSMTLE